jgi:parallel beta-helix repeat protein
MGQDVRDDSRVCRTPPGPPKDLNQLLRPRTKFVAIGLSLILTATGLVYYLMQPSLVVLEPWEKRNHVGSTPHANITIDGDASFSATALLEGWHGDGSPEDPYIIDGLEIDLSYETGHCIDIRNTRVSFTISNCNLTGASWWMMFTGAGIYLENVANGELVNNICNNNDAGICLYESDSITVVNNTCNSNDIGIYLWHNSDSNTVANNTCNSNRNGIYLLGSNSNTVTNSNCTNNDIGIHLQLSESNTVVDNTCNKNRIGIYLSESDSNTVANNTFLNNIEHDIFEEPATEEFVFDEMVHKEFVATEFLWFLAGCGMILVVSVIWYNFEEWRYREIRSS